LRRDYTAVTTTDKTTFSRTLYDLLHGVHYLSCGWLTLLFWLAHFGRSMGVTAPGTELTLSFSMPVAHLRLEQIRGGAEFAGSVCVAAVLVGALFPVFPGVTEHCLTQVWSNPQVQARVRKAAIIITFTRHEELGAKFRTAELLSDCWFHRRAGDVSNVGTRICRAKIFTKKSQKD